ncbi:MAG: cyanophycin synthetase [Burkholderiaceae bacterium]|nr:cyanophycin synthetase [Burkholderiaceae bacterium]
MGHKSIEILRVTHLRGPNMWTYRPVLEALVDIGDLEDFPSNLIPGYPERLAAMLPSLVEHRCSYEERGGFLRRLQEGTWPGHVLEHVTLELQALAGMPSGFGRARETSTRGVYKVVVRAFQEEVARTALQMARDLVMAAMEARPFDVSEAVDTLREQVDDYALGPSTAAIVDAADDRDIPSIRLNDGNLVQLGFGSRQRRIWTAESDRTSAIAEGVSMDKALTKSLLRSCGVPVPDGREVDSLEDAWAAACEIGLPVVVKPTDANHGRGVSIDLTTRDQIDVAYPAALEEGSAVMVERYVPGEEHRLLVVGGKLVAAARGETAWVEADGQSSIATLIDTQLNSSPRRGDATECPLYPIELDAGTRLELSRQGFVPESVPPRGERVLIQRKGNLAYDVTHLVHPSTVELAALAARVVGLDIAGLDLLADDISKPLEAQGGAIVEVNAGPGLDIHLHPAEGPGAPVGRAIVDYMIADGEDGRIPLAGIAGSHGREPVARLLAHLLRQDGRRVGLACAAGVFIDERRIDARPGNTWAGAQRVLMNRLVDAAVLEASPWSMTAEGLGYDRCSVAVVTDIDPSESIADFDIAGPEQLFKVLRTQVDVVLEDGWAVLNATDPLVLEMAGLCDGDVILYAPSRDNDGLVAHVEQGGRAVYRRDEAVVLAVNRDENILIERIPDSVSDAGDAVPPMALLAAVAAAWAIGLEPDLIAAGLATYEVAVPAASVTA